MWMLMRVLQGIGLGTAGEMCVPYATDFIEITEVEQVHLP